MLPGRNVLPLTSGNAMLPFDMRGFPSISADRGERTTLLMSLRNCSLLSLPVCARYHTSRSGPSSALRNCSALLMVVLPAWRCTDTITRS